MTWYNKESERAASNFGSCYGALLGALLHQATGWIGVTTFAVISLAVAAAWIWLGAKKEIRA